jgi:magnesium transporter
VVDSYEQPLEAAEAKIDAFEQFLTGDGDSAAQLPAAYQLKRQLNLMRRLLWRTLNLATRFRTGNGRRAAVLQDLRENAESMHFYAEELLDDVNNLLNMQLALATHRTNEVVKVLTVFSAFFLPLTFLVGVYGMNFAYMPELTHPIGYPAVWVLMIGVSAFIWFWFRRRRWL